jgi:phosphoserine aminotransferase
MRVHNFMAGPAALPTVVLEKAQAELLDYEGTGMSIMENSHRSKTYEAVQDEAMALLRELMAVPSTHEVMFLQGGAAGQFAMVPYNFLKPGSSADYILTGHWGERAIEEAKLVGTVRVAGSTREENYRRIPADSELSLDGAAAYCHYTTNNTIYGSQWDRVPPATAPLVADVSSDILSRPFDVGRHAMIYAGAQKNLGPSGVVIVVAARDFVATGRTDIPVIARYATALKNKSLFHTPPTFAIYLVREVLRWLKAQGGVSWVTARNDEKARLLYAAIDGSGGFYRCPIDVGSRSKMNVVFRLSSTELEDKFVKKAEAAGLAGLRGHRLTGGIRASIYNALGVEDVSALCMFMAEFQRTTG